VLFGVCGLPEVFLPELKGLVLIQELALVSGAGDVLSGGVEEEEADAWAKPGGPVPALEIVAGGWAGEIVQGCRSSWI
jgi:hypothetical protein